MRLRRPGVPILIVLAAATLMALPTVGAAGNYEVAYRETAREHTFDGVLKEGEARTLDLYVAQANVTRVEAVLRWTETGDNLGVSRPDTFSLTASNPTGHPFPASPSHGANGLLVLTQGGITPVPDSGSLDTPANAPPPDHRGEGVYRVTVKLVDTGNTDATRVDRDNAYVLSVLVYTYEASVVKVVSLPDAVTAPRKTFSDEDPMTWANLGLVGASLILGVFIIRGKKDKPGKKEKDEKNRKE